MAKKNNNRIDTAVLDEPATELNEMVSDEMVSDEIEQDGAEMKAETAEQIEKRRKAQQKAAAVEEEKQRKQRERKIKRNLFYYERTIPSEMAHDWLTKGARDDLGITKDSVVSFRLDKGNLVIGCLPDDEVKK